MSESKSEACVKHPTFDGKDENWPFCKKKMESHLARLDLSDLLSGKVSIPKDDAVGSADEESDIDLDFLFATCCHHGAPDDEIKLCRCTTNTTTSAWLGS